MAMTTSQITFQADANPIAPAVSCRGVSGDARGLEILTALAGRRAG
jgi:hypothetical protein